MKIALASDLHFEFHRNQPDWLPPIAEGCNVIVLAGDIGVADGASDAAIKIATAHPKSRIICVAGNHEFYRCDIDRQIQRFRDSAGYARIHFLENEKIEIDGVTFLGCTLWSGFDMLGSDKRTQAMEEARLMIGDFSLIRKSDGREQFTPLDAMTRYIDSRRWLESELQHLDCDKVVVVTHFPPCREARNFYFEETLLTSYFQADCRQLIDQFQPLLWCYGHNHYSDELRIGRTRLVSNQLGYPNEFTQTRYDAGKVIDLSFD